MEYNELVQGFAAKAGLSNFKIADGTSAVEIDGIKVAFIHDEKGGSVTIYGEIGFPPPDANGRFGEAMLKANHLFSGTEGAVLCQNPDTFAYALFRQFPLAAMDLETFCGHVGKLVDQAEGWKRLLEGFREAEAEAEDAAEEAVAFDAATASGSFMRV